MFMAFIGLMQIFMGVGILQMMYSKAGGDAVLAGLGFIAMGLTVMAIAFYHDPKMKDDSIGHGGPMGGSGADSGADMDADCDID